MKPLEGKELTSLLKCFNDGGLDTNGWKAWQKPLSFYKTGSLLRMDIGEGVLSFLVDSTGPWEERKFVTLHQDGGRIHAFNRVAGLTISAETVLDYVRFFTAHVADDEGSFATTENEFFIDQDGNVLTSAPLAIEHENEDGFEVVGHTVHAGVLFKVRMAVQRDGLLEMIEDDGGSAVSRVSLPSPHGPS